MTPEQIKYNLEEDIENGMGMYREVDVSDLKHALRLINEYENTIGSLKDRFDDLTKKQDEYAKSKIVEFAITLQNYYNSVPGNTFPPLVSYHISTKLQEFLDQMFKEDHNGD